jgi:hypothetical protein
MATSTRPPPAAGPGEFVDHCHRRASLRDGDQMII